MGTHRRFAGLDLAATGAFLAVAGGGYLQASTLARSIALWDAGTERQRLDDAWPVMLGAGALIAAAAIALAFDRKPRAAVSVAPAAVLPPVLVAVHASAAITLLASLAAVAFAAGGALGAVFSRGRPRRPPENQRGEQEDST